MGGAMRAMSTSREKDRRVDLVEAGPGPSNSVDLGPPGLGDLPESCIAQIFRFVLPRVIGRLACTSRAFRDAALSDLVWTAKLPYGYTKILEKAKEAPPAFPSKKSVYDFLCRDVFLNEGHEAFRLDKPTGCVCWRQGARALTIIWGNDKRYWDWLPREGSSFPEVAYLKAVCWLEVQGQMECTVPCGSYTLSWRLSLAETPVRRQSYIRHALGHVYGWSHKPVIFTLAVDDDDQHAEAQHYLDADCWERERAESSQRYGRRMVDDKWMEFDVGQFVVEEGEKNSGVGRVKLQYSLIEIKGGQWKSGMFVDGVVIRPSHLKPMCLLDRYVREHSGGSSSEPVPSRSSLPAKLGEVYINDES